MMTEKDLFAKINSEMSKEQTYKMLLTPLKRNLLHVAMLDRFTGQEKLLMDKILLLKPTATKSDFTHLCAQSYSDEEIRKFVYASQSDLWKKIIQEAAWSVSLGKNDLARIIGKEPIIVERNRLGFGYRMQVKVSLIPELKELSDFIRIYDDKWEYFFNDETLDSIRNAVDVRFVLPGVIRELFQDFITKPEGYEIAPAREPSGDYAMKFSVEENIFTEMPLILSYYMQGNIKYAQKGYSNAASTRKMSKTLHLGEFGEDTVRTHLIARLLSDNYSVKSIADSPLEVIHNLFTRVQDHQPLAPFLLMHVKGLGYYDNYEYTTASSDQSWNFFKENKVYGWITVENFKCYFKYRFIEFLPFGNNVYRYSKLSAVNSAGQAIAISKGNMENFISTPLLLGHLYLMAAYGLLELSIDENNPQQYSPYDGLLAFKMTELGKYIFKHIPTYTPPKIASKAKPNFDENSLIVRLEGDVGLADTMLSNYMEKVSDTAICSVRENL